MRGGNAWGDVGLRLWLIRPTPILTLAMLGSILLYFTPEMWEWYKKRRQENKGLVVVLRDYWHRWPALLIPHAYTSEVLSWSLKWTAVFYVVVAVGYLLFIFTS